MHIANVRDAKCMPLINGGQSAGSPRRRALFRSEVFGRCPVLERAPALGCRNRVGIRFAAPRTHGEYVMTTDTRTAGPVFWEEHLHGGSHWSGVVRRGTTLAVTDIDGGRSR